MAGLRFAVLLAASSFGVLLLLAASVSASASRPPAVYDVGDEWRRAAPASNDGAHQTLSKWAMRHRFYVGDVLDFKRSNDSVLLVSQGDYERCSVASPAARRFADGGGDTRFTLAHPGLFHFVSGEPARCQAGQRMVVGVVDGARSSLDGGAPPTPAAPAPAPAPGVTMVPSNRDPVFGDPPMPALSKRALPRALIVGFATGCLVVVLIICLCVAHKLAPFNRRQSLNFSPVETRGHD